MIRVSTTDTFPVTISLVDDSNEPLTGKVVYYDIRHIDGTILSPPNNGIFIESTVVSGVYNKNLNINQSGLFICYITCSGVPTQTKDIIVDQESAAESVWSNTTALQLLSDVDFIKEVEGGRWKISNNQLFLYKEDNVTQIATFNLFDKNHNPAEIEVYERVRV